MRKQWREVILTCLLCAAERGPSYIFNTYVLAYGVAVLAMPQGSLITVVQVAAIVAIATPLIFGRLSDRIGRKRVYMIGATATFVWAMPYYGLLDTRLVPVMILATIGAFTARDMMYGPQAAFIAESFSGRLRYSGASLGYHLPAPLFGGTAPLVAAALYKAYHSTIPVSLAIMGTAVVSFVAAAILKERSSQDLAVEYDESERQPATVMSF